MGLPPVVETDEVICQCYQVNESTIRDVIAKDKLKDIDCSEIEPLRSVCDDNQRMQADEVTISDQSEDLFRNVPEKGAQFAKEIKCFVVPKVIE